MTDTKYVYYFGDGQAEGKAEMKNLLGGKGANLAEMTNLAIPVPPGFTITTETCIHFLANNEEFPEGVEKQVLDNLALVERSMGQKFGDENDPLLVSCRSGARASMPGMMDTVLNIGLTEKTLVGMAEKTGNKRFVLDCYRRLIHMYGNVVMGNIYDAEVFLDVKSYKNVLRWAKEVQERPAYQRGQRINKAWGPEELRVPERHDASDVA